MRNIFFICLFFYLFLPAEDFIVNSKSDQADVLVRKIVADDHANGAVSVNVNGQAVKGQIGTAGLNSSGAKELVFVAPKLMSGENKISISSAKAEEGFQWQDGDNVKDLTFKGQKVFQYVYPVLDESSKASREKTYKPFVHVYDKDGKDFITKGAGGKFTHHRGIYYGFSKCSYTNKDGKKEGADTWHCKGGAYQAHKEFLVVEAGPVFARLRVKIDWHGPSGVFAQEVRELSFYKVGEMRVVDFASKLSSDRNVKIDGDPQHAGFQYRASNEVHSKTAKQTYYLRHDGIDAPGATKNWPGNKDMTNLAWKGQSTVIGGQRYTVCYLDNPQNPKPAYFSERNYGRFGSYFKSEVTPDQPLKVNYRLTILAGELQIDDIAKLSSQYTEFTP